MTREQERINAACEYGGIYSLNPLSKSLAYPAFLEGAEWADKTMIEKACKWLINIDFDGQEFRDCDETFNNDLFVDAFRKVMQNE